MIPIEVSGSRLPVGSSASSSGGWLTNARATETRCCSPPESWSGEVVELQREAGQAQDVGHLVADLAARAAGDLQRVGDVLVDGPVRQQLVVLEHDADVAAVVGNPPARDRARSRPATRIVPAGRLGLLDQQPHRGRLAGAGGADEEDELAGLDRERDVVERRRRRSDSAWRRSRSRSPRAGTARARSGAAERTCLSVAAIVSARVFRAPGRCPFLKPDCNGSTMADESRVRSSSWTATWRRRARSRRSRRSSPRRLRPAWLLRDPGLRATRSS